MSETSKSAYGVAEPTSTAYLTAATGLALVIAYGPLLFEFFSHLWTRPQYQHFPFVLAAFGWLLATRMAEARPRQSTVGRPAAMYGAGLLMAVAWLLLAVAYPGRSPWLAYMSFILLVAALFVRIEQKWQIDGLWGVWLLLWLVVPLPLNRDQQLITVLQRLSSRASSLLLDFLGVLHLMDGNKMLLPDKQLFVDEACSGIVSVISIIACAVIYGVWRRRAPVHVAALAIAGIGWATVMNTIRISSIAFVYSRWGIDWSAGTPHEVLSLAVFTLTFAMLISTDSLLLALLATVGPAWERLSDRSTRFGSRIAALWDAVVTWRADEASPAEAARPRERLAPTLRVWSIASIGMVPLMAFAALASVQAVRTVKGYDIDILPGNSESQALSRALALGSDALPNQLGGLKRSDFRLEERNPDDIFGRYSRMYEYRDDHDNLYIVSCDFPFGRGWHELTDCYRGNGWDLKDRQVIHEAANATGRSWNPVKANFSKPDGTTAQLLFCLFDETGAEVSPPTYSFLDDMWRSLWKKDLLSKREQLFQIQVWTTGVGTIPDDQKNAALGLVPEARIRLVDLIAGHKDSAPTDAGPKD
jgi:exosortase